MAKFDWGDFRRQQPMRNCHNISPLGAIWQFLVCLHVRGAPGEGQGDPGARRRPEDPGNVVKPIGNLWKTSVKATKKENFRTARFRQLDK